MTISQITLRHGEKTLTIVRHANSRTVTAWDGPPANGKQLDQIELDPFDESPEAWRMGHHLFNAAHGYMGSQGDVFPLVHLLDIVGEDI